jgi:hypothetical protein
MAHTCNPSLLGRQRSEGSRCKASLGKYFERPYIKITRVKWTGGVTQMVECLLCKGEALSSDPNPIKNKKTI